MSRFALGLIAGQGTPGNDSFTKILMHFDGANGSGTFTDSNVGGSAHTWSTLNPAITQISTGIAPKFGSASLLCPLQITTPDHADFVLGSGDWTVDFWFNPKGTSGGGNAGLFGQQGASFPSDTSIAAYRDNSNKIQFVAGIGGSAPSIASTSTFTGSSWVHIAFVRNGSTTTLYVNGTSEASVATVGSINNSTSIFGVGGLGAGTPTSSQFNFDEFRLSVGIARWTANFTPASSAYT